MDNEYIILFMTILLLLVISIKNNAPSAKVGVIFITKTLA